MKNKIINAAICDAREVTEESLSGFDKIIINAASLIAGERSKELLNRYHVSLNVSEVIDVPDGQKIDVNVINGTGEIGPGADGTGIFLVVNGKLTVLSGSEDAVKSYSSILVNGKAMVPDAMEGKLTNMKVNGKTVYYPDGATILARNTAISDLFVRRAANSRYYCPGNLFILDETIDTDALIAKGLYFSAKKIIVAESLLDRLIDRFDEEAGIVRVPDGTKLADGDLELKMKTIRKFGNKLCVPGDVTICDADALSALEYLFVTGKVIVSAELEDAFEEIDSEYGELKVVNPCSKAFSERLFLKIGPDTLRKYPGGISAEHCMKVRLSPELTPEEISEKLSISECAVVVCTKAQEEAVTMISENVAKISADGKNDDDEDQDGEKRGIFGAFFGEMRDSQVINASVYKM